MRKRGTEKRDIYIEHLASGAATAALDLIPHLDTVVRTGLDLSIKAIELAQMSVRLVTIEGEIAKQNAAFSKAGEAALEDARRIDLATAANPRQAEADRRRLLLDAIHNFQISRSLHTGLARATVLQSIGHCYAELDHKRLAVSYIEQAYREAQDTPAFKALKHACEIYSVITSSDKKTVTQGSRSRPVTETELTDSEQRIIFYAYKNGTIESGAFLRSFGRAQPEIKFLNDVIPLLKQYRSVIDVEVVRRVRATQRYLQAKNEGNALPHGAWDPI